MKITLPKANYSLPDFYDAVAREMGYNATDNLHYDCTKVNVSREMQDSFYDYYTALARENLPEREIRTNITMLLLMSGPKVDDSFKGNEVEVFDGFIC